MFLGGGLTAPGIVDAVYGALVSGGRLVANAVTLEQKHSELKRLEDGAVFAQRLGLIVNAGHGLTKFNVAPIVSIGGMHELNIGHSLVARALLVGLPEAVREFRWIMDRACG